MATIDVDVGPFLAGLNQAVRDFDQQAEEIVLDVGDEIASLAVGFAPHGATGELEGSIGVTAGRSAKGPYVDVGTSLDYGFYQEFGTSKMRAHPFMRPALAQAGAVLRAATTRSIRGGRSLARRLAARRLARRPAGSKRTSRRRR